MKRLWVFGILIFAFAGLADSIYLTQNKLSGTPLICNIQSLSGCNIVADSPYSKIFGIPISELGILFYSIIFILAALELAICDRFVRRTLQAISFIGVLSSVYFTALQVFFIGALCIYCIASAVISVFIFIFAIFIEPLRRNVALITPDPESNREGVQPLHLPMPPKY